MWMTPNYEHLFSNQAAVYHMYPVGFWTPDAPFQMVTVPVLDLAAGDAHGESRGHTSESDAHQSWHWWFG
jgi:hypothetical protein